MKKSYSNLNVLQERLSGNTEERGFFSYFFNNRPTIEVKVPYYEYLRGEVFCDDLRDNFESEVPFHFDASHLIYLLYEDFLRQIKMGAKNEQIAKFILVGKQNYFRKRVQEKRIMKPISKYVFEFETVEEEEIEETPSEDAKMAYITIRMKKSELLRAEVLLHDLQPFMSSGESVTVEEVIAIVFLNFIEMIKKEGNTLKLQKSILTHLK
ncbi:hypothetical protein [Robertmurraya sp. FSL R5-0851]|uniref:hypothetical protein n=1 Tax=Robertmurraya sp. FSL R5-0851 TaxID=2921584 RepID=UPI0030F53E8F